MQETLPVWFLITSIFLPRISLIAAFFTDGAFPHLITKWVSVPMGLFIPRILILWAIAATMGFCAWFWIHLVIAVLVLLKTSIVASEKRSSK